MTWNGRNREWYKSKGYKYSSYGNKFEINADELIPSSCCRVRVKCDYCGNEYNTKYTTLTIGRSKLPKDACFRCAPLKTNDINLNKRASQQILLAQKSCEENGYQLLTSIKDYINVKMDAYFICPKHGKQKMKLENLIMGHKCFSCSYENRFESVRYSQDEVKSIIENVNRNKWINYGEYKNSTCHNLSILCSCGKEYVTTLTNYMRKGVQTCYSCSNKESVGEKIIKKFLENNNIVFEQEKRFQDCRDKRSLPFDFYLPEYNLCIEFDGIQHFKELSNNYYNLKKIQYHDSIKNSYCKNKNINLLRISYLDRVNISEIISQELLKEKYKKAN